MVSPNIIRMPCRVRLTIIRPRGKGFRIGVEHVGGIGRTNIPYSQGTVERGGE